MKKQLIGILRQLLTESDAFRMCRSVAVDYCTDAECEKCPFNSTKNLSKLIAELGLGL